MNEGSIPTTPKKARSLPSCLSEKRITSEKRIRFGNKATVDYHEGDPASVVSPLLQRVESDISTRPSAITEIDYPENLETSRNTSILAQFDDEPDVAPLRRHSMRRVSLSLSEDGTLEHRETADMNELNALLEEDAKVMESKGVLSPRLTQGVSSPRLSKELSSPLSTKEISSPLSTKERSSSRLSKEMSSSRLTGMKSPRLTELLEAAGKESMVDLPSHSSLKDTGTIRLTELLEESRESRALTTEDGKRETETRLTDLLEESKTEEKTPRLTELLEEAEKEQSEVSRSSDVMDTEETVLLQGLLDAADAPDAPESSNMEMSLSGSDTSSIRSMQDLLRVSQRPSLPEREASSRRSTLCLGDMKSALLREFDRHERRSSMMTQRLSEPPTDTLPTNALLKLLPEEPKAAEEESRDEDATMELQQLSNQLRRDLEQLSPVSAKPSVRSSMEETLARMSAPSEQFVADVDNTVTQELRRLSQLIAQAGEPEGIPEGVLEKEPEGIPEEEPAGQLDDSLRSDEKTEPAPHFSPLLAQSGRQMVIHEKKSSQRYGGGETPKFSVVETNISRSLFHDDMKEVEREVERTEKEVQREIEEKKDVETSINMETYFLPSVSHSLLEDSQIPSATPAPLESSESSVQSVSREKETRASAADGFARSSMLPLPSPILSRSSGGEPSLSPVGLEMVCEADKGRGRVAAEWREGDVFCDGREGRGWSDGRGGSGGKGYNDKGYNDKGYNDKGYNDSDKGYNSKDCYR